MIKTAERRAVSEEQFLAVRKKDTVQRDAQNIGTHNLSDADRQHEERERRVRADGIRNAVGIFENRGDDQDIGDDRRERHEPAATTKQESAYGADQRRDGAEDNIQRDSAREQVGNETADEQPGDRCRGECRQDTQRLGDAELDRAAGQSGKCCKFCQYHVKRGNDGALCDVEGGAALFCERRGFQCGLLCGRCVGGARRGEGRLRGGAFALIRVLGFHRV